MKTFLDQGFLEVCSYKLFEYIQVSVENYNFKVPVSMRVKIIIPSRNAKLLLGSTSSEYDIMIFLHS